MPWAELESDKGRIGVDSAPAIRPGIVTAEIDGELVLYDPVRDVTRRLGAAATVVWQCIDGTSTIGEIADDVLTVQGGERGRVVADLVRRVRGFAGAGLLRGTDGPDGVLAGASVAATPSPVPADPCAHSNEFGWVGRLSVVVGDHLLGIRCNDTELLALLHRLFAPIAADVPDPEPNFSVRLGQPGRAHRLQEGCRTLVHSTSLQRVVNGLCSALSAYADQRLHDRVLLDTVLVVRQDAGILVPQRMRPRLGGAEDLLNERGLTLADAIPALTPDGGTVVIAAPGLGTDRTTYDRLCELATEPARPNPGAGAGSYRLAGWAWPGPSGGGAPGRAYVAVSANRAVRNRRAVGAERALNALAHAVAATAVAPLPVGGIRTEDVLDAIARAI